MGLFRVWAIDLRWFPRCRFGFVFLGRSRLDGYIVFGGVRGVGFLEGCGSI